MVQNRASQQLGFMAPMSDALASWIPTRVPNTPIGDAMTLGYVLETKEPFPFDPWQMMADGRIDSTVACVFANKNHGKTSLAKTMMLRLGGLGAGEDPMKIYADNFRRNHNEPEYRKIAKLLHFEEITFEEKFNFFDLGFGFSVSQYLSLAMGAFMHNHDGKSWERHQPFVLQVVVNQIFSKDFEGYAQIELIPLLARGLTVEDVYAYYAERDAALAKSMKLDQLPDKLLERSQRKLNINPEHFAEDASIVAERFERFLNGDNANKFGGMAKTAEKLAQNGVFIDFSNMEDEDIAQMQAAIWSIKRYAYQRFDKRFMYHIEIHDENYKLWKFLSYAIAMSDFIKQARAYQTFVLLLSHRRRDYESIGELGSVQRQKATGMLEDVDMFFYGKQSRKAAEEIVRVHDLDPMNIVKLMNLEKGQWGVIIGTEDIVYIGVEQTSLEDYVSRSNEANLSMLKRRKKANKKEMVPA